MKVQLSKKDQESAFLIVRNYSMWGRVSQIVDSMFDYMKEHYIRWSDFSARSWANSGNIGIDLPAKAVIHIYNLLTRSDNYWVDKRKEQIKYLLDELQYRQKSIDEPLLELPYNTKKDLILKNMEEQVGKQEYEKTAPKSRLNINQEVNFRTVKFFDTEITDVQLNTDGSGFIPLNFIHQGEGQSERVGRRVYIREIDVRLFIRFGEPTPQNSSDGFTMHLVLDRQTNGHYSTWTDVFTDLWLPMRNMNNTDRYQVIKTWKYVYNPNFVVDLAGTLFYSETMEILEFYKKTNIKIDFNEVPATEIGKLPSNNLYLFYRSKFGWPRMTGRIRVKYNDNKIS